MKTQIPLNKLKSVTSSMADRAARRGCYYWHASHYCALPSRPQRHGRRHYCRRRPGAVTEAMYPTGVAVASDGARHVAGITDSFTTDQFGNPSPRIFLVKFAADGSLSLAENLERDHRQGLGRTGVALGAGDSVYVTGVSTNNGNDAVLLKFDASGTLLWERTWGGPDSDKSLGRGGSPDGSAYIAGTATSFGPSSLSLFVVKFDSLGNLVWQRISDGAEGNAVARRTRRQRSTLQERRRGRTLSATSM